MIPALSAANRKLEAELNVQIVQRGQRFEGFTTEGQAGVDAGTPHPPGDPPGPSRPATTQA
jgi:hypothetical protein